MAGEERQQLVKLTTKLETKWKVPLASVAVPTRLTRYGLSEVVNTLLGLGSESAVPFDFLVEGELLRTSLEQLLLSKRLSSESVVNIEYFPAALPPKHEQQLQHPDWVSAVCDHGNGEVVSGSYDNIVRVWNTTGECQWLLRGHSGPVTAVTSIFAARRERGGTDRSVIVSASKDRTLCLWKKVHSGLEERDGGSKVDDGDEEEDDGGGGDYVRGAILKGHTASVQAVACNSTATWVCSGGWDSSIRLWRLSPALQAEGEAEGEEGAAAKKSKSKRRKLGDDGDMAADKSNGESGSEGLVVKEVRAEQVLEGHSQAVVGVSFSRGSISEGAAAADDSSLVSCSWDHSVRVWDILTATNTLTLTASTAVLSVSVGGEGSSLIAAGVADNAVRIWDTRAAASRVRPLLQLISHTGWVSCVKWWPHAVNPVYLISSSYDGTLRLWDIRSKIPLHTIADSSEKLLCADWVGEGGVGTGGADGKIRKYSGKFNTL